MKSYSSLISSQIRFLLHTLDDSNSDSVFSQLRQFMDHGSVGPILVLRTCLEHISFAGVGVPNLQIKPDFLAAIFRYLLGLPNCSTVFCEAFGNLVVTDGFPGELCEALNLSIPEKIGMGLALADSDITDIRKRGQNFCLRQIEELRVDDTSVDSTGQVHNIIMFLYATEGLTQHVDSFLKMMSLMEPKEDAFVLAPFLSDDICETSLPRNLDLLDDSKDNELDNMLAEMESETSMADIMRELGYGCTFDTSHCKEVLSLFLPLTELTLSRILITLARTNTGLDGSQGTYPTFWSAIGDTAAFDTSVSSSWNINVFVETIKELAPGINWIHVMEHLDNESFYIPNEDAFSFLMSVYSRSCKDPYPLHALCGSVWENVDGQLSFLRYAVSAPPDVFTFAHSSRRLEYSEALNGHELPDGQANQAWLSLDLLELLCQLSERGYANAVHQILEFPLKQCPAILLLGISHINTAYNLLQRELCSTVLPMIVSNSLGSAMIHHLWQSNPQLVLRGLTDMIKRDEGDMSKILEICQELKVLSHVLDQIPFGTSVQMAAFSSEKEYLNLDKWLNSKLSIHKNVFFEECIAFLKDASVGPTTDASPTPFQHSRVRQILRADTRSIFIKALQIFAEHFGLTHSLEELNELRRASHVISKPEDIGTSGIPITDEYDDDIEARANIFFHNIFSDTLTIDEMIVTLASLRDSSNKRDKTIFDCIIQNLFDEYKFFPKYPETQLKIAAVLLGSLIKHQLVTHLTLGIALRKVLDAIRKPTDSKLFTFGTMALDQFLDRLAEWPQYCNHILQISHLRGTRPGLVTFIEQALARVSSNNSEVSNIASADLHTGISPGSVEHVEILGSMSVQPAQISSPVQMQHRQQGLLGDRHNTPTTTNYNAKPLLPSSVNQINIASGDGANSQKSLQTVTSSSAPANGSSSSSFLHSSRAVNPNNSVHRQNSYSTGFGSALNIETLVSAAESRQTPIEAPGSDVQEKILFLINNISSSNIEVKAKEFTEILDEQYYPWFAQYMVMKRASIEPNFHDLYLKFLEKFNSRVLNKEVVKAAYENCKVLLKSELIKSSSEERSLLKNLGSWLGKFTIGRNQVLRSNEIDPKALIIEAYEKGRMIAVIPFTSKILEPCHSSVAYRPPNPWTMAILSLLAEIYTLPNLKMNLKFDIEVLFKNLGVDMKEIKPAMLLKDRQREMEGNPDFSNKDIVTHPPIEPQPDIVNPPHPGGHIQYPPGHQLPSVPLTQDEKITTLSHSNRLPSGQVLSQVAPSQSPYSSGQLPALTPNIGNHIIFNPKLNALGLQYLQRILPVALDRAIKEVTTPVVQRSVAIAIQTTKELVLKDYAMESDETRIYNAAHLMVASLAGSLAHVTCKEPLRASISTQLRNAFQGMNIGNELVEQAVPLVMNDNLDLGCAVIEQAATDKALQTIDGEIAQQLSLRRKHRESAGSPYYDASMYTQGQLGVIPETLRPRPFHLTHTQQRVYEDFVRYPWQNQSASSSDVGSAALPGSVGNVNSSVSRTNASSAQLNPDLYSSGVRPTGVGAGNQPVGLIAEEIDAGSTQLLSGSSTHAGMTDGVTTHAVKLNSATPYPAQAGASDLLSLEASNAAKELGATVSCLPITSTTELLGGGNSETLFSTKEALEKYEPVAVKVYDRPMAIRENYISGEPLPVVSAEFCDQVSQFFVEWCQIYELHGTNEAAAGTQFISQLQRNGFLNGDDTTERFILHLMDLSVSHCLSLDGIGSGSWSVQGPQQAHNLSFFAIDVYAKLVVLIVKYRTIEPGHNKLFLLPKILSVMVKVILRDAEDRKASFNSRPYFRLFISCLYDLMSPEHVVDVANFQFEVLISFANAFHALQPLKVPAFSFAWLELVSHRSFMPKLLNASLPKGWIYIQLLLVDLFKFMEPYLRNADMGEMIRFLYKGTLRVLLVLLHDFPEFLCNYHFSFCDAIPSTCIQMRNVILSAFPRNMRLPDPSTLGLKIDLLPEICDAPQIFSEVDAALKQNLIKVDIDEFVKTRHATPSFLSDLKQIVLLPTSEVRQAGTRYNIPLLNSLVLYMGMQIIQQLQDEAATLAPNAGQNTPLKLTSTDVSLEMFHILIREFDTEGSYHFLNSIANQLRYPNNHTHFYSFVVLYLFAEAKQEIIQEQITRVLLERLIVSRPHPWGLLITFIELIKNTRYNFWSGNFTRIAPEIEKLFESVARSCGPRSLDDSIAPVTFSDMH